MLGFGATSAEMKAVYDISYVEADIVAGQHAAEIRLVPKTKEMQGQVSEADLWISDFLASRFNRSLFCPEGTTTCSRTRTSGLPTRCPTATCK